MKDMEQFRFEAEQPAEPVSTPELEKTPVSPIEAGKGILKRMGQLYEGERPSGAKAVGNTALNLLGIGDGLREMKKGQGEGVLSKAFRFGKGFLKGWLKTLVPAESHMPMDSGHFVYAPDQKK